MSDAIDRRSFLSSTVAAGLGVAMMNMAQSGEAAAPLQTPAPEEPFKAAPLKTVRVGFIGVGGQGSSHVRNFLRIQGVELKAVCDLRQDRVERVQDWTVKAGQPKPQGYWGGPEEYKKLCAREDLDLVFIATPWEYHVPMCVEAMKNGKHAATEVPASYTLEGCWELVETAEKTRRHCVMQENCNYGRFEMLMLHMARLGMLGELLHGECGYLHDLREIKFNTEGEGTWRRAHATKRNGNFYPTHGLGPIANCMDINRGDQFDYIVSMSSNSRGLALYAAEHLPKDDPRRKEKYVLGDVNSSLIRTKKGRTIIVTHNCDSPRPYSRVDLLQGTKGIMSGYPLEQVYIEGKSPTAHTWESADVYYPEYEHPLWKNHGSSAKGAGHGGMDYLEDYRLVQALLKGEPTDSNVYDAAAISSVCALSEMSVAGRSKPIDFPDFTRGRWKTWNPWTIVEH